MLKLDRLKSQYREVVPNISIAEIIKISKEYWNRIRILALECKSVVSTRNSIRATIMSSLWVWTIVNLFWYLYDGHSGSNVNVLLPFIAPLVIAPLNQLSSYFYHKNLRSIRESAPDKNPNFVLHIEKETWSILLANKAIKEAGICTFNEGSQVDNLLHNDILKHYYAWDKIFEIKVWWQVYIFTFGNDHDHESGHIISLYWLCSK